MKNGDVGLNFKTTLNGYKKEDVNDYIVNMKCDFQRIVDEKEDELLIFKNLNAKLTQANEAALEEKENQIKFMNVKMSGLATQLENLEKEYKSDLEKFEIIKMNLEKELNEKSGLNRFEIDQLKNEMVTEIEQLQKEITQNRMELSNMDEVYRVLQQEKSMIEEEKFRLESELKAVLFQLDSQKMQTEMSEPGMQEVITVVDHEAVDQLQMEVQAIRSEMEIALETAAIAKKELEAERLRNEALVEANSKLKGEFGDIDSQKEALVNVLVIAQRQAEALLAEANRNVDMMVSEAKENAATLIKEARKEQIVIEEKAKTMLEEAKARAAEEVFRAQAVVGHEREKLMNIRKEIKEVREGIIEKLDSYKEGLDLMMLLEADKDKTVIPMRENHG